MSHVVQILTQVRDPDAVAAACRRLGLPGPVHGTATLFESQATGLLVHLPDWQYPVVIDTASGEVKFDNYEGHWGEQQHFDRFLQMYAVEKARLAARARGHLVSETQLQDGSIRLQITEA